MTGRVAVHMIVCALSALGVGAPAAASDGPAATVAGLTVELLDAASAAEVEQTVAASRVAGLSDIQIANALGRASAQGGRTQEGGTALFTRGLAALGAGSRISVTASFRAGEMTAHVLADYRGLSNTPWGGSGGSTGGRNE